MSLDGARIAARSGVVAERPSCVAVDRELIARQRHEMEEIRRREAPITRVLLVVILLVISTSVSADFFARRETDTVFKKFGVLTIGDLSPGEVAPVLIGDLELCIMDDGAFRVLGSTPILAQPRDADFLNLRLLSENVVEMTLVPISAASKFEMIQTFARKSRKVIRCRTLPDLFWQNIEILSIDNIEGKTNIEDLFEHLESENQ